MGNDVYGAKDGSVYKRSGQGSWEQMGGGRGSSPTRDSARTGSLESQYRARSTGSQRSSAYSRSRASAGSYTRGSYGGGARGGGMARGGGGRRR